MSDRLAPLAPVPHLLVVAVVLDLLIGDPAYAWHPIRLVGGLLTRVEARLRAAGLDGRGGGVLLFVVLAITSVAAATAILAAAGAVGGTLAWVVHTLVLYSLFALGDLIRHVWRIERAVRAGDLGAARTATAALVGRDTDRMDAGACRRAAVESLSENLTDGFVSPLFWYVLGGIPGLVLFKVVSTMDSMVGYKTPRYLRFGWCGARLDDAMNYVPARLTWIMIVFVAALLPTFSGRKAWAVGLRQHAELMGPNAGWSEAATAGALQRRIVGPIWLDGWQVTDRWIGDPRDAPLDAGADVARALALSVLSALAFTALGYVVLQRLG